MKEIQELFQKSQENISTHQKLIWQLRNIYKTVEFRDVARAILLCLDVLLRGDYKLNTDRTTRSITFVAQFVLDLITENSEEEDENRLVRAIVDRTLQHMDVTNVNCRYHATQLLESILKQIRTDIKVSQQLCDDIQDHLIDRFLTDTVLSIRILCASALVKLQDIDNPRCPTIAAYMSMCTDPSPTVRKHAVMHLAITHSSHEIFVRLMRDMDAAVRLQAYKRVGSINPSFLKIVQRQQVILNGIDEEQVSIRKVFHKVLLPKWLQIYDNNLLSFYNSVRLDAFLSDIEDTRIIHDELMKLFFKCFSPREIVKYLPIGEDGLVPIDQLTSEVSAYWYHFIVNVQKEETCDVEIESILPQLTPFCEYVKSVVKSKEGKHLEHWQKLQFQEVLYNLFRIISISDLADEVGRQHLLPLIKETLINAKLDRPVIGVVLEINSVLVSGLEEQCEELCGIMSEIRECIHASQEESVELTTSQKMELSQLKAKIYILEASVDKAIEEKNFSQAESLHNEITEVNNQIQALNAKQVVRQPVVEMKLNAETMCRCLDILEMFLRHTRFSKLPSSLRVCLNEFVKPGMQIEDLEVHGRIFLILGQFCILDKSIATENTHFLCSPLVATKYGRFDKCSLLSSLQAVSDIVRAYGPDMLGGDDEESMSVTSIDSSKSRRRRLYQEAPEEDIVMQCLNITRGLIMDTILDLLDAEDEEIRHIVTMSLMKLVMNGLLVNSSLLTRLMLKWLNPYIEKHDPKMHQIIANGLLKYAMNVKNSGLVIQRTIVPTLNCIGNAPDNSPFQDVELDHVLQFLCNMMMVQRTDVSGIHKSLALEIIRTIKNRPKAKSAYTLSKMLLVLEPVLYKDENFISESIDEINIATQYLTDVKVTKVLMKYKALLTKLNRTGNSAVTVEEPTLIGDSVNRLISTSIGDKASHQRTNTANKENENQERFDEALNGSHSSDSTLLNSVIQDSQSSVQSITCSLKERLKKNKGTSSLRVIIERSPEIDRLSMLTPLRNSNLPQEEIRKQTRKRGTSKCQLSENGSPTVDVNHTPNSPQSTTLTRSTKKSKANTATPHNSSSSLSTSSFTSTTRLTRNSRKARKRICNSPLGSSSDETVLRRSARKKERKIT